MDSIVAKSKKFRIEGIFDSRGGWNRYKFQTDFFKKWSNEMAYVLGFLYADGNVTDAAFSSRTQYIKFSNKDREIIKKIKSVLKAEHPVHSRSPRETVFPGGKVYKSSKQFYLRIGSKVMFADLIKLGLFPNKSKTMEFPSVPSKYLSPFVRGYFDGDGTIYIEEQGKKDSGKINIKRASIIFSSGSKQFLKSLSGILAKTLGLRKAKAYNSNGCFQTRYSIKESVEIFKFMYKSSEGLFLKRKFNVFKKFFDARPKWLDKETTKILNKNEKYLAAYPRR